MTVLKSRPIRFAASADLVGSRTTLSRAVLRRRLQSVLHRLTGEFARELLAAPVMTRGIDEMSVVFRRPDRVFSFLADLNVSLWPDTFRVGLGAGIIDVGERSRDAGAMDGPAFHRAADALRRVRREHLFFALSIPDADGPSIRAVEALADAFHAVLDQWTPGVARAIRAYRSCGVQEEAARELGISQQAVSKLLRRGSFDTLARIEEAAAGLLSRKTEPS